MTFLTDEQKAQLAHLETVHIVKLSQAARMAGLPFKNGTLNKAGILEQLSYRPSVLATTIAVLSRIENGTLNTPIPNSPKPSSFLDDLAAENAQQATPGPVIPPQTNPALQNSVDAALKAIGHLQDKVSSISGEYCTQGQARRISSETFSANIKGYSDAIEALKTEVITLQKQKPISLTINDRPATIISGQHELFPTLIEYLQINKRVILTGPAGTGKSMAAKTAAESLGVKFYLQPPISQSYELIGHRDASGAFHETPLFQAYTKGGLILMDEADASAPDAMLVANPIFDGNGFAMFGDGKLHAKHADFFAILNMNTNGMGATMENAGRNRLDGATMARFSLVLPWTIDVAIETRMADGQTGWLAVVRAVRAVMKTRNITDTNATTRHTMAGALILNNRKAQGKNNQESRTALLEHTLKSGATAEIWSIILALPEVREFLLVG